MVYLGSSLCRTTGAAAVPFDRAVARRSWRFDLSGILGRLLAARADREPVRWKEWVLSIRDQCRETGVPFFFKQWGGVRKAKNGRLLDGRTYDEYPERSISAIPERSSCSAHAEIRSSLRRFFDGPLTRLTA